MMMITWWCIGMDVMDIAWIKMKLILDTELIIHVIIIVIIIL